MAADDVGGVAHVLAGVQVDVQVGNVQLGVVLPADDGEASGGVVDVLPRGRTQSCYKFLKVWEN